MLATLINNGSFDDTAPRAMGAAFDLACRSLPHLCHGGVPEIIAKHIIEAVSVGERDPAKLSENALRAVSLNEMLMPAIGTGRLPPRACA